MIALARRSVADRARSLGVWSISIGLMGVLFMAIWPSVEGAIGTAVDAYPESVKQAFGITDLSTPEQYLAAELMSLILPLALAIFAARNVAMAIDGAQERGHLDVLLSAPISRRAVVAATFAALTAELATILAASWAMTYLAAIASGAELSLGLSVAGFANLLPLALFAASVAMAVTGLVHRSGAVTGLAVGTVVAMYVLDLVGRLDGSLDAVRYVSVFRYYGSAIENGIDPLAFAGVLAVAALLAAAGTALFERRDIA